MKIPSINFAKLGKQIEHLITDNSPTILTAIGVIGVGGTAVLTHRAATQAKTKLEDVQTVRNAKRVGTDEYNAPFTKAEIVTHTWKFYVAPVSSGVVTAACIIGANRISARRAAALAGVLAVTQDNFKEYKEKVTEKMTGPAKKKMDGEMAQDRADKIFSANDFSGIAINDGDVLCVERFTGRPFSSSRNKLERAVNDMNKRIIDHDAACLSEFYDMINLEHTGASDQFGWNTSSLMEVDFLPVFAPNGRPAMLVDYVTEPQHRPWEAGSFKSFR